LASSLRRAQARAPSFRVPSQDSPPVDFALVGSSRRRLLFRRHRAPDAELLGQDRNAYPFRRVLF